MHESLISDEILLVVQSVKTTLLSSVLSSTRYLAFSKDNSFPPSLFSRIQLRISLKPSSF